MKNELSNVEMNLVYDAYHNCIRHYPELTRQGPWSMELFEPFNHVKLFYVIDQYWRELMYRKVSN